MWFVDYDNGVSTSQKGKNDIENPQSSLTQVLSDVGPGDTIFVRPRTTVGTQGTNATKIVCAAGTWTIPRTMAHLSIIGTGLNGGDGQILPAVIFQSITTTTTPTFLVHAPFFTMENCAIFADAEADSPYTSYQVESLIKVIAATPGTNDGYGAMINNCSFHNWAATAYAALCFDSGRYNVVKNSHFWHCRQGVFLFGGGHTIHGATVQDCDFHGRDTDIDADITISSADHVLIDNNRFHHETPAKDAGAYKKYVDCYGTAYGLLSNNTFATTDTSMGTLCDLSNMLDVGNKCSANACWVTI